MAVTSQSSVGSEIPSAYRAAVVQRFGEPLTIEQVPRPDLPPGQVRVKVEACGVTRTSMQPTATGR